MSDWLIRQTRKKLVMAEVPHPTNEQDNRPRSTEGVEVAQWAASVYHPYRKANSSDPPLPPPKQFLLADVIAGWRRYADERIQDRMNTDLGINKKRIDDAKRNAPLTIVQATFSGSRKGWPPPTSVNPVVMTDIDHFADHFKTEAPQGTSPGLVWSQMLSLIHI